MSSHFRLRHLLPWALLLASPQYAAWAQPAPGDRFNDWVIDPPGQNVCDGHYVAPYFTPSISTDEIFISANQTTLSQVGTSILTGDVSVEVENLHMFAREARLYRDKDGQLTSVTAHGNVLLEEPSLRLAGDDASLILAGQQTTIEQAQFRLYSRAARGTADEIYYAEGKPLELKNATYTTCAPESNVWKLSAREVDLNKETGRGEAKHTFLQMYDLPVFYVPYFNFPIDDRRKSGFLAPDFGTSSETGFFARTPYYFNLAPNYDATFSPSWMEKRGWQWGGAARYLDPLQTAEISGDYISQDPTFIDFQEDELNTTTLDHRDPRYTGLEDASGNRWAINFSHAVHIDPHWRTQIEYHEVSDDNYYVDLGLGLYSDQIRQLDRRAQVTYLDRDYNAAIYVQDYQTLQPFEGELYSYPYIILPHVEFNITEHELYDLNYNIPTEFTYFEHVEDPFTEERPTIGGRSHIAPYLTLPYKRSYGYFMPGAELRYTQYDLNLSRTDEAMGEPNTITRGLPSLFIDTGLFFDKNTSFFNTAYTQTLEPRLFYLYTPIDNQNDIPLFDTDNYEFYTDQLFRTNRFNGLDRIGDANQVSLALTSRLYDEQSGIERFKTTIGQIIYFAERHVVLCDPDTDLSCNGLENPPTDTTTSPLVGDLNYQLNTYWSMRMDGRLDPHSSDTNLYGLRFHYQPQVRQIIHFGFLYDESGNVLTNNEEPGSSIAELFQTDIGATVPIGPRWTLLGRWYYDIENQDTIDTFGGVEYENCCWAVRLGARRYLNLNTGQPEDREFENQYFFQWVFKGLVGVGPSPVNFLSQSIPGYTDRFEGY